MLVSPKKNGLTSLFKEVRVFKVESVTASPPSLLVLQGAGSKETCMDVLGAHQSIRNQKTFRCL